MYDLPWWVMGVICMAVVVLGVGGLVLLIVLISRSGRRRGEIMDDFDDRPRRRPRRD